MKRKFLKISLALLSAATLLATGCKKNEDPEPAPVTTTPTPTHTPGSVEGTMSFAGGPTKTVSGTSTNSSFGYIMSARNMTPANSYPSVSISFSVKPTKDSVYAINTNNFVSVGTNSNDQYYSIAGGNIIVTKSGTDITAKFTNVTVHNSSMGDSLATASLTAY
jgi:hypothetical protein